MQTAIDQALALFSHFRVPSRHVPIQELLSRGYRLDPPAFVSEQPDRATDVDARPLKEFANVFTVYIQSPLLAYVRKNPNSRPYLTTSEVAEYVQVGLPHVSLIADPRLIDWEIREGYVLVSRSGRVGEAYWVDERLAGALV